LFSVAAASVRPEEAPKAVSKVIVGVSAGMVIGVPVSNFIAGVASLEMAMVFFAVVNAIAFVATILFVPSMPVKERLSYGFIRVYMCSSQKTSFALDGVDKKELS
jgi:MFS transporter, DHA1 family, inner membrane transport protein